MKERIRAMPEWAMSDQDLLARMHKLRERAAMPFKEFPGDGANPWNGVPLYLVAEYKGLQKERRRRGLCWRHTGDCITHPEISRACYAAWRQAQQEKRAKQQHAPA
jgi:hypothetical protein